MAVLRKNVAQEGEKVGREARVLTKIAENLQLNLQELGADAKELQSLWNSTKGLSTFYYSLH